MKNYLSVILIVLVSISCLAQKIEKVALNITDEWELYLNDEESKKLHYLKMLPKTETKGVLVLLPSGYERTEDVLKQIEIHTKAIEAGMMVVVPSINWGTENRVAEFKLLDIIFKQLVETYSISEDSFILGGLSNGGMIALSYAEKAVENPAATYLKPKAVFGLDTPLDKAHFYEYCQREIRRNFSQAGIDEAKWILNNYHELYGGSPSEFPQKYINASIYSNGVESGGNAKFLKQMPIRMYTDLDLDFLLTQRRRDLYDWNGTDIVAMINDLKLMGNEDATVKISMGKGRRLDGTKHPHSWSILDTEDFMKWIHSLQ